MTISYHTSIRPLDGKGQALKPMDIVLVKAIPNHYWCDPDFSELQNFAGSYGLISYVSDGIESEPYFLGNKSHPGWVNGDGSLVHLLTRRVGNGVIVTGDFWVPPADLVRLPFNALLMNIFVEYPWQMQDDEGGGSSLFIKDGMFEYDFIKRITEARLSVLNAAHNAAMNVLENSQNNPEK